MVDEKVKRGPTEKISEGPTEKWVLEEPLEVQESTHLHQSDTILLETDLIVQESSHAHSSQNVDLTQQHTLVVQSSSHSHAAENIVLSLPTFEKVSPGPTEKWAPGPTEKIIGLGEFEFTVQGGLHAHTSDEILLYDPAEQKRRSSIPIHPLITLPRPDGTLDA